MLPPVQYHTFETRLVKIDGGFAFYRLSKDPTGKFYFISKEPMSCRIQKLGDSDKLIKEIELALQLPAIDFKDIIK